MSGPAKVVGLGEVSRGRRFLRGHGLTKRLRQPHRGPAMALSSRAIWDLVHVIHPHASGSPQGSEVVTPTLAKAKLPNMALKALQASRETAFVFVLTEA